MLQIHPRKESATVVVGVSMSKSVHEVWKLAALERCKIFQTNGSASATMISHSLDKLLHAAQPSRDIVRNEYLESRPMVLPRSFWKFVSDSHILVVLWMKITCFLVLQNKFVYYGTIEIQHFIQSTKKCDTRKEQDLPVITSILICLWHERISGNFGWSIISFIYYEICENWDYIKCFN